MISFSERMAFGRRLDQTLERFHHIMFREWRESHYWTAVAAEDLEVLALSTTCPTAVTLRCVFPEDDLEAYWSRVGRALQVASNIHTVDIDGDVLFSCDWDDLGTFHWWFANMLVSNVTIQTLRVTSSRCWGKHTRWMAWALKTNSTLRHLNLARNDIGNHNDVQWVATIIQSCKGLSFLCLCDNCIDCGGAIMLAHALQDSCLMHLDLSSNYVGGKGAEALARSATLPISILTTLLLHDNPIDLSGTHAMLIILESSNTIYHLDLSYTEHERSVPRLPFRLAPCLRVLNMSNCGITSLGFGVVAEAIQRHAAITDLDLSRNELGEGQCLQLLSDALRSSRSLTRLNLANNSIGRFCQATSGLCLCDTLGSHQAITDLNISGNIGFVPAMTDRFCLGLRTNTALRILDLNDSGFFNGAYGLQSLGQALLHNRFLSVLLLCSIRVNWQVPANIDFIRALKDNTSITKLSLRDCFLDHDALSALVDAVSANDSIIMLDLGELDPSYSNHISTGDFRDLGVQTWPESWTWNEERFKTMDCGTAQRKKAAMVLTVWAQANKERDGLADITFTMISGDIKATMQVSTSMTLRFLQQLAKDGVISITYY